jgi:curved DNA-binding protein CbpA
MGKKDPYAVLNVPPGAELSQIEAAYWRLAADYNAVLGTDPEAPGRLRALNEAYESLATPQLRREFDERLVARASAKQEGIQQPRRLSRWLTGPSRSPAEQVGTETRVQRAEPVALPTSNLSRPSSADSALGRSTQSATPVRDRTPDVERKTVVSEGKASAPSLFRRLRRLWRRHPFTAHQRRFLDQAHQAAALRESTAATVARWRQAAAPSDAAGRAPSPETTFQSPSSHSPAGT